MKKVVLPLAALGALVALGVVLVLVVAPDDAAPETPERPGEARVAGDAAPGERLAPAPRPPAGEAEERQAVAASASPAPRVDLRAEQTFGSWAAGASTLVEGRVELPGGVPADDELVVLALSAELDARDVYGEHGLVRLLEGGGEEDEDDDARLFATAPVASDGSFELRFPAGRAEGWVAVFGRWLYSDRARRVPLDVALPMVTLRPEVGALVTGRVTVPDDLDPAEALADARVELELDPSNFSLGDVAKGRSFDRAARVRADGTYELRAVAVGPTRALGVEAEGLAYALVDGVQLEAGRERRIDVELVHGGTVAGRVVDEGGEPVAGAEVVASRRAVFGFAAGRVAEAEAGEDGTFVLEHVAPGEVLLSAESEGLLPARPEKVRVEDRGRVEGVTLALEAGTRLAGRVVRPDGTPVAGAEVEVDFDPAAMMTMAAFNAARGAEGEAETDAEGRFEVGGLGRGPFVVHVEGPGDAGEVATRTGITADTHDLELVLRPAPELRGRVVSTDGAALREFTIRLRRDVFGFAMTEGHVERFESDDGTFVVEGLEEGGWRVRASAEGYGASDWISTTLASGGGDEALELVVPRAATARGRVVDPEGRPVAGAKVTRELEMPEAIAAASGAAEVEETRSEEDGTFELDGLAPGALALVADHPDWASSAAVPVELEEAELLEGIELRLRRGGAITGEVYHDDGEPAQDVQIILQDVRTFLPVMTRTGTDGRFRSDGIDPGSWRVTAFLSGFEMAAAEQEGEEPDLSAMLSGLKFEMAEVKEGEETHVVLGGAPADPVVLTGRVTRGGEPVRKAMVYLMPEGAAGFGGMSFLHLDEDGRFETRLDGPGNYLLQVQQLGRGGLQQNNLEFPLTVPEVEEHAFEIELPSARIAGRVLDSGGDPVADARVTLGAAGGVAYGTFLGGQYVETTTGGDGGYVVESVRPGVYTLAAGGTFLGGAMGGTSDHGRVVRELRVEEGDVLHVDFRLPRSGEITGQVVDVAGTPVANAAIFVRNDGGLLVERFSMTATDGSGRFRYTGLAPGEYAVTARTKDMATAEPARVRVESGRPASVRLVVDPGTILRIAVTDRADEAVRARISVLDEHGHEVNGMVSFQDATNLEEALYTTAEQRTGPLPPGRYVVTAYTEDGRTASKPVTLTGQAERKLKIRLR